MKTGYWIGITAIVAVLAFLIGSGIQWLRYDVTKEMFIDCEKELDVKDSDLNEMLALVNETSDSLNTLLGKCEEAIEGCNQDYQDCLTELDTTKINCGLN